MTIDYEYLPNIFKAAVLLLFMMRDNPSDYLEYSNFCNIVLQTAKQSFGRFIYRNKKDKY